MIDAVMRRIQKSAAKFLWHNQLWCMCNVSDHQNRGTGFQIEILEMFPEEGCSMVLWIHMTFLAWILCMKSLDDFRK